MNATEYQEATQHFAIYPSNLALEYLGLGLASEAGEVAGKIKKLIRGDDKDIRSFNDHIKAECGDVLWYLSQLFNELSLTFEDVMQYNIDKLAARKTANTLKGSGDDR